MPALLAVCGRRMFWPSRTWRQDRPSAALARLTSGLARRPALVAVAAAVCLAALAAGMLRMRMATARSEVRRTQIQRWRPSRQPAPCPPVPRTHRACTSPPTAPHAR
ncbi:hypothetical protein [Streptomyces sp. NPDC004783]|uniref:hypothetical protein n=1 Tax=Streptomyces sp. NPDC004783 TaxID=3154459 RepID=UPI0033AA25EF